MTTKVAPWLEGLSDAWELPQKPSTATTVSSASHDAGSLRNSRSRIPRRSLSGLPSSLSRHSSTSQGSLNKIRNPLAPLSSNDANTLRHNGTTGKMLGAQSMTETSDGSSSVCGTVQVRSKSASPIKTQQTLEWKRRLLNGDVGYRDQTDLFGPSGLENIFAKSKGSENEAPRSKKRMSWLQKSDTSMPSSPPPWPSSLNGKLRPVEEDNDNALRPVAEEVQSEGAQEHGDQFDGSFRSNPFDLASSHNSPLADRDYTSAQTAYQSSPDKAFIEPTEDETAANRTVSGQTELEQEDFSPVYISKTKTLNGQVDYAALDSHLVKQFQSMKVNLRHPSQDQSNHSGSASDGEGSQLDEQSGFSGRSQSDSQIGVTGDVSFPENLPTGSPLPTLGRHVEFKRGGYSQFGSFKQRPLSPSQSVVESSLHTGAVDLISPQPSVSELRPPAPSPPNAPSTPILPDGPTSRSSGSPLKLFGAHDTFTNDRLLRRMSQLNPDGTLRYGNQQSNPTEEQTTRKISTGSNFGSGELDEHGFNAEITITSASDSANDGSDGSPGSEVPVPGSKNPVSFRFETSPEVRESFKMKLNTSKETCVLEKVSNIEQTVMSRSAALQPTVEDASESQLNVQPAEDCDRKYGEGKRPPTSPFKNPTPKRRRTLHASELENDMATVNHSYHSQLQEAVSSRKRKDARQGESQNKAGPEVLAQRKILRPRNPTPSQRRRQQIQAELREAAEEFAEQEPERLEAVMEQIDSSMAADDVPTLQQQAHTLAAEVAAFSMTVQKPSGEHGERKRSVTTQDFLDEAMMVMNLIRAKSRPQSNLGSIGESDTEAFKQSLSGNGGQEGESLLRVSRPPSREGSGWRQPAAVQTDARVISHLRKFQEDDERDNTDFIARSVASLTADNESNINEQVLAVDEESMIRITGPPSGHLKGKTESDSLPNSHRSQGSTLDTQNSAGTSTGHTIGTSSTRKSENVGTLAPDAVAHLIGDQVGGMTFDKDKKRWVRMSKSPEKTHGSFLELPSNVTSDDDPFREISDLPVDEQKEMRRISSPGKVENEADIASRTVSAHDRATEQTGQEVVTETRTSSQETVLPRPVTRDGGHIRHNHSSSVPSRYTAFASSQQQDNVETRATSWSDEELAKMSALGKARVQQSSYFTSHTTITHCQTNGAQLEAPAEEDELPSPSPSSRLFPQNEASVADSRTSDEGFEDDALDGLSGLREDTALDLADWDIEDIESPKLRRTPSKPMMPPSSTYREATRQMSLRRKTLTNRLATEVHERSELSFVAPLPGDRMMSLSLSVSRPVSKRNEQRQVTEIQSSPCKVGSSMLWSDLPEFTVHEEDAERPSEKALATRLAQHAVAEISDRYALAIKELVKILTDVNEDEPYWEDVRRLDLHDRYLASLHGLSDFCARIQDLDVSNNGLTLLDGSPASIRRLNARSNRLTSLTPWTHLMNLQYLDISNNHLDDLNGLNCLIHLRELRVDDNNIKTINGIFELDGLLKVSARRNNVQAVNFEGCQLQLLTHLDLCENKITRIEHMEYLDSLVSLRLDGNKLSAPIQPTEAMLQMTSLSMRGCDVTALDVSMFPRLKTLNVDDNRLFDIQGLSELNELHELSMQRQTISDDKTISVMHHRLEARVVRLSGNNLPSLDLSNSFLNMQHLELASVGLRQLPDDFGERMPNLRTLNLNFNSIEDIRPLVKIEGLERLTICGNRLKRLRKAVRIFEHMGTLKAIDLRDNPLTQGFHASLASTMSKRTTLIRKGEDQSTEDEDERLATFEKARYELPSSVMREDEEHRGRLDEETALKRRVYEVMLAHGCPKLQELDGLQFDRAKALRKDSDWHRLVELGVIRKPKGDDVQMLE